ncbi:MAG: ABC transporter ATP-binding protein [candidate division Zixibacteria bacterium]|nr:ABC transporter ATP-binding protein [candidate division Zixibacteria bacterium]MBU1470095.1 ABC transporter ATP-binding protein [candidate division Zixibacteria bacterium]MBU2624415.1 ABC transporter ATP-binding protein [candidate division Zixibacteria bacterium]
MITLNNICYRYPRAERSALDRVTLTVRPGEIFTLLGPNGAGKTTLIRILSGLIIPQQGQASICGYDTLRDQYAARQPLGLVLGDERTFYYRLSGRQNLEFFGGLLGLRGRRIADRINEVLEMVGMTDSAKHPFMKFSTGMRKRLNFARALLSDPSVYLLDEPNSGVDPASASHIREIILDLKKRGKTILLTTHNLQEAERLSDAIGFLKAGILLRTGSVSEFRSGIERSCISAIFGANGTPINVEMEKLVKRIRVCSPDSNVTVNDNRISISLSDKLEANEVINLLSGSSLHLEDVRYGDASLEDVFFHLAGGGNV